MDYVLILPNKDLLEVIRKDLNEDSDRLERQIELFKEWLRCEPHLPKDVDEHLIQTFVRSCKCNLEKSKQKFEKFLAARIKLKNYYSQWIFDEKFFKTYTVHKQFIIFPDLTPKGYRVVLYSYPASVDEFIFDELMRYFLFLLDYLYYEDTSAGFIIIGDLKAMTAQHLAKINIGDVLKIVDLVFNMSPLRTKEVHFIHLPKIAEALVSLVIKVMNEKIQKRVRVHHEYDLTKIIPKESVPREFGGSGMSMSEHGDLVQRYFTQNPDWVKKTEALKLAGPIPTNKKSIYSFEEFEMQGSFRKLAID